MIIKHRLTAQLSTTKNCFSDIVGDAGDDTNPDDPSARLR